MEGSISGIKVKTQFMGNFLMTGVMILLLFASQIVDGFLKTGQ
jgi:hypothetical protein